MIDFDMTLPTRLIFGRKKEELVGKIIKEYGYQKILFVYGGGSIKSNGLYETVVAKLKEEGIEFIELSGVTSNPDVSFVTKGLELIREEPVDFILAVGGGSVIDVSKSIADNFYYDGDPLDFNKQKAKPVKALPLGCILTLASAGSETSSSCVISDYQNHFKGGYNSETHRCLFAIEDPELTYSAPKYQVGAGIIDMMMHSMERYFSQSDDNQLCDDFALSLCRNVVVAARKLLTDPFDYDARAQIMLASSLAHNDLTHIGKYRDAWYIHPLEHAVSAYDPKVTHGAGIGVLYLGWAKFICHLDYPKFARFARVVFDVHEQNDEKAAIIGITEMRKFYLSLGMPTTLKELGIKESDIPSIVKLASGNGTRVIGHYPQPLEAKDIESVYRLCL